VAISAAEEAELFGRLLELGESERIAVLGTVGLDEESRWRLLELLELEPEAEDELEREVLDGMRLLCAAGVLEAGMRAGRFEVLQELGRGGMGEVWLVEFEQEGVQRRGALKVLRQHLLGPEQLVLWERERRLLAHLSHPYIAGMIDSGTLEGGVPFLLMEYVEGQRMDVALEGMSLRERVEVMRKVCDAVRAAHRQMVVHRDLKPGNVMITPDGFPKLVDFGIGQALNVGQEYLRAGTGGYSSPEQLAGAEPTMASDVFSLGRMLEQLAGGGGPELVAIWRKASATDPVARYETVGQLEGDLRRWLNQEPVSAYGDGVLYYLRSLVRRQPLASAGVGLAVVLVTAALILAWGQYQEAQRRAKELRSLAGVAIFDVDQEVRQLPGSLKARQLLLEPATKYLASLEASAQYDKALRAELADAYQKTARLMFAFTAQSLQRQEESFALSEKAFRLREELGQFHSKDPKIRKGYGETARDYGDKLRLKRRLAEADTVAEKARLHAEAWVREEPGSWEALEQWMILENIAARRLRLKGLMPALEKQRQVVARLPELQKLGPPAASYLRLAAEQYRLLGGLLVDDSLRANGGREFLEAMTQAVRAAEEFYQVAPGVLSTRSLLVIYSEYVIHAVELDLSPFAEMERVIRRSEEILNGLGLPDREADFWAQQRMELNLTRAWLAIARKDYPEMERLFALCRQQLDAVRPPGQMWVALRRAHLAQKEAEVSKRRGGRKEDRAEEKVSTPH
jgi:eukaryotic-like serine/threonine-protein kinase